MSRGSFALAQSSTRVRSWSPRLRACVRACALVCGKSIMEEVVTEQSSYHRGGPEADRGVQKGAREYKTRGHR